MSSIEVELAIRDFDSLAPFGLLVGRRSIGQPEQDVLNINGRRAVSSPGIYPSAHGE